MGGSHLSLLHRASIYACPNQCPIFSRVRVSLLKIGKTFIREMHLVRCVDESIRFSIILHTMNNQGFIEYSNETNDDLISFVSHARAKYK